eukprot:snap_masked-scaffold_121-processed-gene-0.2-mRNA-1 protein AED:1.00 eAED:1.00 QI:0/-1/0/0/-1/1/1/0/219
MSFYRNLANSFDYVNTLNTTAAWVEEFSLPVLSFKSTTMPSNELMEVETLTICESKARASFQLIQNIQKDSEMILDNIIKPVVPVKKSAFSFGQEYQGKRSSFKQRSTKIFAEPMEVEKNDFDVEKRWTEFQDINSTFFYEHFNTKYFQEVRSPVSEDKEMENLVKADYKFLIFEFSDGDIIEKSLKTPTSPKRKQQEKLPEESPKRRKTGFNSFIEKE